MTTEPTCARAPDLPKVGFGTFGLHGRAGIRSITSALDLGCRHLDTASIYGNEKIVGRAVREARIDRADLFLTTKVWVDHFHRARLRQSVEDSLRHLATGYVDLLLLHWPNPRVDLRETIDALRQARDSGQCRYIGVSNFPGELLGQAVAHSDGTLEANQVEYHPYLAQDQLLVSLRVAGMALIAHSPLAHGRVAHDPVLRRIGESYGKSASQVALRWLVQQDPVAVIPSTTDPGHLRENLAVEDFELSPAEMVEIHQLTRRNRRLVAPSKLAPAWS